ncbi:rhodanese-like domain-containing protein [Microbacterium sp. 2FI]|uniref:sulfurtransferase n=1 Tax=Microbacterium sp. 2FI TaxID=2502193 RepID=UPI0010F98187|nr:rhodanese-like domain-containing protein [Microbacterium sp. 2FI]
MRTLIEAPDLARELEREAAGPPVTVIDVSWVLGGGRGPSLFGEGHIPGARDVELARDLAGPPGSRGRLPLPTAAALTARLQAWGVSRGGAVVATDGGDGRASARAWWVLRHAGVDARILDGGTAAWVDAGLMLERGAMSPRPGGDAVARFGAMPVVDWQGVRDWPTHGILIDARSAARYEGSIETLDPRAGHIPGAVSAPASGNLTADGRFRSPEELRDRFLQFDVVRGRDVAVYCGAAVAGAQEVAALAIAGIDAALYVGSWSEWSRRDDLPIVERDR